MSLIDRKINSWSQSVSSLDDKPQMTAASLKAVFDSNSNQLKPAINGIIDDLTGTDGANNIGLTAIDGVDGKTVQAVFESLSAFAKNTDDDLAKLSTADGAGLVGVSPISGVSGETVQAVLQNLATLAKNNKLNLEKISSADGAELVGVSPISGVSGETVQAVLQSLYNQIIEIDTGDPNPAQYIKKTEKGAADGVASLDSSGKVPETQLPELDFIKNSEKGVAGGVATLDVSGKIPQSQLSEQVQIINDLLSDSTTSALSAAQGKILDTKITDLKTSVSEGKTLVAAAVTDKGIQTAADATFQQIATNINNIPEPKTMVDSVSANSKWQPSYGPTASFDGTTVSISLCGIANNGCYITVKLK